MSIRQRYIVLLASVGLVASLLASAQALTPKGDSLGYGSLDGSSRPWVLESPAPAKVWDSLSLRQNAANKTILATLVFSERASHVARTIRAEQAAYVWRDPARLPERISPRAPPTSHSSTL